MTIPISSSFVRCRNKSSSFTNKTNHTMGAQVSKIEDTIHDIYKKTWPQAWLLLN
jgi:hypothetical protein